MASSATTLTGGGRAEYSIWRVILASAVGTMIEWYDFYIFGSLAARLPRNSILPATTRLHTSPIFHVCCRLLVRPFGALFFGRIGDIVGRKYAFIVTLSIMGGATALSASCRLIKQPGGSHLSS